MQTCTIRIPVDQAKWINGLLNCEDHEIRDGEVIVDFTGKFPNGCEADLKLVSGGRSSEEGSAPPYLDPVLFDPQGHEISIAAPDAERIEGEYNWEALGETYQLTVEIEESTG